MSDTQRLWSVTTLLKLGMGTSDPLVNWAVGTTAEYAIENGAELAALAKKDRQGAVEILKRARYQTSGAAKARGSELHAAAEKLALGVSPEVDAAILPYVEQYKRFLADHEPVFLMAEAPVYSPSRYYAGTCDGIVALEGQRLVFDIKTTDKAPDQLTPGGKPVSRPPYAEVALQLAAYRRAELVGVLSEMRYASGKRYYVFNPEAQHEPMPETDGAVCIVVSPFDYTVTPVRTDDEVFRCFIAARECARFNVDVSRRVFGPQITTRAGAAA